MIDLDGEPERPGLPPYETVRARADVAFWDLGEGQVVLLLHTFPDHSLGMLPLARELADAGFRVVVPTLPGYWPSGRVPDGDYALSAVADDLLRLLDELDVERAHVVGHGWGGELAYRLGAESPGRVGRAVALSVPHVAGLVRRHRTFQGLQSAGYAYFLAYSQHAPAVASQPEWLTAVAAWAAPGLHREDWPQILALIARPSEVETAGRYYRCDLEAHVPPQPVRVPTLVVHGADSQALPPTLFEGLERWFPAGLKRHVITGAGQWPHLETPAEVVGAIVSHLRDG